MSRHGLLLGHCLLEVEVVCFGRKQAKGKAHPCETTNWLRVFEGG
jgi:hypothetical protein